MAVRRFLAAALATGALLTVTACGGDPLGSSSSSGSSGSTDKGSVTIGGQNFTESQIMAAIYQKLLESDGYDVQQKLVDTRDIYFPQLQKGNVQVVPDYLAGIGDYLNIQANGPDADPITSNSPDESLKAVQPLAEKVGVTLLTPAQATDQNGFFVAQDYASQNNLTTLSDLGALGDPIKLAAAKDCAERDDCQKGLESVYGIDISDLLPLGFGLAPTFEAVQNGEAQLGQTGTTDGTLDAKGLVLLEDDKGIQPAQNLTPAVNADWLADHPDVKSTLDELSSTLTTEDLAALNLKVDQDREKPVDVADEYLSSKGLI